MMITSFNAVMEALRAGNPVQKIWISRSRRDHRVQRLMKLCRDRGVLYRFVPREALDRRAGAAGHQGLAAEIAPVRLYSLEEVLTTDTLNGLFLLPDGVTDTGNLGALLRSAAAADVDGVILPRRRSAALNEAVMNASAGAMINTRVILSRKVGEDIDRLKHAGYWVFGAAAEASTDYRKMDFTAPLVLVVGGEAGGISPFLRKRLDQLVRIPHSERVESLNVSVAAGILLFEILRQRCFGGAGSPVPAPSESGI